MAISAIFYYYQYCIRFIDVYYSELEDKIKQFKKSNLLWLQTSFRWDNVVKLLVS